MTKSMIVAPEPEAVEVGADILRAGGNAVDAAIACAFAQGVVDPMNSGIAGFGSMGVYTAGERKLEYVDFHAPAPKSVRPDMWAGLIESEARDGFGFILSGNVNDVGYQSVCVPASLRAYEFAHKRYGRMPWGELVGPAIDWARRGWKVKPYVEAFWSEEAEMGRVAMHDRLAYTPGSRKLYCREDGRPKRVGDWVLNPNLADTLQAIAREGSDVFYKGEIGRRIIEDFTSSGGLLTYEDLATYEPILRQPLWTKYRGYDIGTNQPPGGGLTLLQMLNMLENFDLRSLGLNSPQYIRIVSEVMKRATIDKDRFVGDLDYVEVPVGRLSSKEYAQAAAESIVRGERSDVLRFNSGFPCKDTTHVSVVDRDGNCVTMTHSLGMPSGVVTDGLGFMYNGCMGVFDPRPGRVGSLAPGKARFSSICPSIVFDNGSPLLVIGGPGATQIAMGVVQAIVNVLDFNMTPSEAVASPRFSATSNAIDVTNRILRSTTGQLEREGYEVIRSPLSFAIASVHAIKIGGDSLEGGADPGAGGLAVAVD